MFKPQDSFSENLLKSIPKKFVYMLATLDLPTVGSSKNNMVHWDISPDGGVITYVNNTNSDEVFQISWDENAYDAENICASSEKCANISNNLSFFVDIERTLYSAIEESHDTKKL